jgi:hypothetical protein
VPRAHYQVPCCGDGSTQHLRFERVSQLAILAGNEGQPGRDPVRLVRERMLAWRYPQLHQHAARDLQRSRVVFIAQARAGSELLQQQKPATGICPQQYRRAVSSPPRQRGRLVPWLRVRVGGLEHRRIPCGRRHRDTDGQLLA